MKRGHLNPHSSAAQTCTFEFRSSPAFAKSAFSQRVNSVNIFDRETGPAGQNLQNLRENLARSEMLSRNITSPPVLSRQSARSWPAPAHDGYSAKDGRLVAGDIHSQKERKDEGIEVFGASVLDAETSLPEEHNQKPAKRIKVIIFLSIVL